MQQGGCISDQSHVIMASRRVRRRGRGEREAPPRGFEPLVENGFKPEKVDVSPALTAPLTGFAQPEGEIDPDLAGVVAAWRTLPAEVRAGIVAMVSASVRSDAEPEAAT
jgi:hypothetical protein